MHGSRYSNRAHLEGLLGQLRSQDAVAQILKDHDCYPPNRLGCVIADPNGLCRPKDRKRIARHLSKLELAREALESLLGEAWVAYWLRPEQGYDWMLQAYRETWRLAGLPSKTEVDPESGVVTLFLDVDARKAARMDLRAALAAQAVAKARRSARIRLRRAYFAGKRDGLQAWERIKKQAYQNGYNLGSAGGGVKVGVTLHLP